MRQGESWGKYKINREWNEPLKKRQDTLSLTYAEKRQIKAKVSEDGEKVKKDKTKQKQVKLSVTSTMKMKTLQLKSKLTVRDSTQ